MLVLLHANALPSVLTAGDLLSVTALPDAGSSFFEAIPSSRLELPGPPLEEPSALVILDRDHQLHFCASAVDDRAAFYHACFKREAGTWEHAGSHGLVSPHVLDAPESALALISAPDSVPPDDAALGYWAGMLIAGGRATTAAQALLQARHLIETHNLTSESTASLKSSINELIQDFIDQGPASR